MKRKIFLEMYLKKNLGDDLFLKMMGEHFPDTIFYVDTNNSYLRDLHICNIHGYNFLQWFIHRVFLRIFKREIRKYPVKVILGGSMFIEQKKTRDELSAMLARKYSGNRSLFIIGSNFGPYQNNYYIESYKKVFARADDICFREKYSADLFKDLKNVRFASDAVFGLETTKYKIKNDKKIIISVIDLTKRDNLSKYKEQYENKIAEISDYYSERGYDVVLMSFCRAEGDENVIKSISSKTIKPFRAYFYNGQIDEALYEIASAELIVGTRFHSIVLGFIFGKKTLPIIYSKKTINMLSDIKYEGKKIPIKDMHKLDVSKIDIMSGRPEKLSQIQQSAKKQFEAIEKFLQKVE